MKAPADKTAKRLSAKEWSNRFGAVAPAPAATPRPAADRIAVRV